jgi:tetratricopeptide (TPR) repeat protein
MAEIGTLDEVRDAAEAILARKPDFAPALNNLTIAYTNHGRLEEAIEAARRVLAADPDNPHALSNLIRALVVSGRAGEARSLADRLVAVDAGAGPDPWLKKAEALSFLGDDERMPRVFEEAERAGALEDDESAALLLHYAAVAELRRGDEQAARKHWAEALRRSPTLDLAEENLADLEKPPGERHAPWPFSFPHYIALELVDELMSYVKRFEKRGGLQRGMREFLAAHPHVAGLVPVLLDRGDSMGRELALQIAMGAGTPELLEALKEFVLGRRGPDRLRVSALDPVVSAGLLPRGAIPMWVRGAQTEINFLGLEITTEPVVKLPPKVQELLRAGSEAIHEGDFERARELYERVLELRPDDLSARFNLALVAREEGDMETFETAAREIHREHPDYVFARTSLAEIEMARGRIDEAEALVAPLREKAQMHFSEAQAFINASIQLDLARGRPEDAGKWLAMWEEIDPESPLVDHWGPLLRRAARPRGRF